MILLKTKYLLDVRDLQVLYNAQLRPFLEFASLSWMSASETCLGLLDKVQRRAYLLVESVHQDTQPASETTLQHRREVVAQNSNVKKSSSTRPSLSTAPITKIEKLQLSPVKMQWTSRGRIPANTSGLFSLELQDSGTSHGRHKSPSSQHTASEIEGLPLSTSA